MKIENSFYQCNQQLAVTKNIYSVHNHFCNCHQLPTRRNIQITQIRDYPCPYGTLASNPPLAVHANVKNPKINISKRNQLKLSCLRLTLVISQSFLSDKERTPSTGNTRDRDRSDQKKSSDRNRRHLSLKLSVSTLNPLTPDNCASEKTESLTPAVAPPVRDRDRKQFPGKTPPQYHIELTLSPSILGPVYLCFSKGVCSSIASARDRLDQKQPPRETLTSPDDNSNDLAKTTTYPLSVSHTPIPSHLHL